MAEEIIAGARNSRAPYREAGVDADGGLLFEPRAFWSVQTVTAPEVVGTTPETEAVVFDREHFRNGGRWPIKLTRIALAPINYHLISYDCTPTTDAQFRNCMAALNFVELLITPPNRQHWMKQRIPVSGFLARPTGQPTMRFDDDAPFASSIWGSSFMRFDKPLRLPPKAAIEFDLGTIESTDAPVSLDTRIKAQLAFLERGGTWNGNVRTREEPNTLPFASAAGLPNMLPPDGFPSGNTGASAQLFDPANRVMSAGEFVRLDPSRKGSLEFEGITFWLDQLAYDAEVNDAFPGGANLLPVATTNLRVAPMALRTATRVRTRNGGTGTYWWRPGCPLGLVANEITPALTYDLPVPITLEPGDCLDLQMFGTFGVEVGQATLLPTYNLGVALTGFAIIQG